VHITYGITKTNLYYEKAEVEHGAGNCYTNDAESVETVGGHAEKGKKYAEFKT
jgi:hypothetical protein